MSRDLVSGTSERPWLRAIAAVGVGAIVWHVVLGGSMGVLRAIWPAYDAAYPERDYTLVMLWVRLLVFSATVVATAVAAGWVARDVRLSWFAGFVILALSIPDHLVPGHVWDEYPVWYHLLYLVSILPLAFVGGRGTRRLLNGNAARMDDA